MNKNGEQFLKDLQEVCTKHNVAIFAGMFGLKFNFMNESDKENNKDYYTQNLNSKEFLISE